jgi:hypothetical protein
MPRYATALVLVHLAILMVHKSAHENLQIGVSQLQLVFLLTAAYLAPLVGAALLWTRYERAGAGILGGSIFASLLFGVAYHFLLAGADNVRHAHEQSSFAFVVTAVLLGLTESWICAICLRHWRRLCGASGVNERRGRGIAGSRSA